MHIFKKVNSMHAANHIPTPEAIIARATKIGLPISRLADEAGLNKSTVARWKIEGKGSNLASLQKMAMQLERRERQLLAYLIELYPDAAA